MNLNSITRSIKKVGLLAKKYSPEIMVIAGVAGGVTSTVMACKATLQLEEVLDDCKKKKEAIEECKDNLEENDYKKQLAIQTVKNGTEVAKLYAPSVVLGVASVSLIFGSTNIMRRRNASLAAAYATLDDMYRRYRKNVKETFGEEVDYDMRYGITHEIVEEQVVDENGKTHTVKKTVDVVGDINVVSDYARFFDESCTSWDKNPEYNLMFLKGVEAYCNNLLKANGYLFLNDVYKSLGMQPSIAGQSVGWIYDDNTPIGDNYVDFGLYRNEDKATRRFINGLENVILLDFNVDGDILNDERLKLWKI